MEINAKDKIRKDRINVKNSIFYKTNPSFILLIRIKNIYGNNRK